MEYFIKTFENSVKACWNNPALTDYKSSTISYGELAERIEALHLIWKEAGLKPGDKIALNARSCANWGAAFMAIVSGGYVSCQIFNGFTPTDAQKFVSHSDSKILFTEKSIFKEMDFESMPQLLGAIDIKNMELLAARNGFDTIFNREEEIFYTAHPSGFTADDINYPHRDMDDVCLLNYTSGSTGVPKGVMLTVGSISSNVDLLPKQYPYERGEKFLSVLPLAHIFGLIFDLATCMSMGMHMTILGMPPAPSILRDAFKVIKPKIIIMVPVILAKMTETIIGEFVHSRTGAMRLRDYKSNSDYTFALRTILHAALGGNCKVMMTGGAPLPSELEELLTIKLQMPLVTVYGMTECGPIISLGKIGKYKTKSAGEIVSCMQAHIDSPNPNNAVGELWVKGTNTFIGYYKNAEADVQVFTSDGWLRTGDLGTIDKDGTLFLVGRCKSMLLGSNGENIYPEEIEVKLNTMPYIAESLIVQRGERFYALIVPNSELLASNGVSAENFESIMNKNIASLNSIIPSYASISGYELHDEPFAKTPKGSIKRFQYK